MAVLMQTVGGAGYVPPDSLFAVLGTHAAAASVALERLQKIQGMRFYCIRVDNAADTETVTVNGVVACAFQPLIPSTDRGSAFVSAPGTITFSVAAGTIDGYLWCWCKAR